ncbi:hypothetical protein KPL74_18415 [Bacillus sp. NP157]|nr:hypothetical protein KPL74_18415 [Bacillus sp. NP157]
MRYLLAHVMGVALAGVGQAALAQAPAVQTPPEMPPQACPLPGNDGPTVPSVERSLTGQLVIHDNIRGWVELVLDEPTCGMDSVELYSNVEDGPSLWKWKGCHVRSVGTLDFAPNGYFSADVYQTVVSLTPIEACEATPPGPDYSKLAPDPSVHDYRVAMDLIYGEGEHPVVFHVTSHGKELTPYEVYASYYLTGSFVLYGSCGKGFAVDEVWGTPEAKPSHFDTPRTMDDKAQYDPETAAVAGVTHLALGYSCTRDILKDDDDEPASATSVAAPQPAVKNGQAPARSTP